MPDMYTRGRYVIYVFVQRHVRIWMDLRVETHFCRRVVNYNSSATIF